MPFALALCAKLLGQKSVKLFYTTGTFRTGGPAAFPMKVPSDTTIAHTHAHSFYLNGLLTVTGDRISGLSTTVARMSFNSPSPLQ